MIVEIIAVGSLVYGFVALLLFLQQQDKQHKEYIKQLQTDSAALPGQVQQLYLAHSQADQERQLKANNTIMNTYLEHIARLEQQLLFGKPADSPDPWQSAATTKTVINEIEQEKNKGVELTTADWTGLINADTRVAFEEDDAPTMVE